MTIGFEQTAFALEKVLLLPGWFGDSSAYADFVSMIDPSTYSTALVDYRGYGKSKEISGEYTLDEICNDALEIADSLGWGKFNIIGHSMGGKAAQYMAAKHTDRVKSVAAIAPAPACAVPLSDEHWNFFQGAIESQEARFGIIHMSTGERLTQAWVGGLAQASMDTSTKEAFAGYLNAWAKEDFAADAAGTETPMKVFVGEHDPSITKEMVEQTILNWYPKASVSVVSNAGHYPMFETPIHLAREIEEFFGSQ